MHIVNSLIDKFGRNDFMRDSRSLATDSEPNDASLCVLLWCVSAGNHAARHQRP